MHLRLICDCQKGVGVSVLPCWVLIQLLLFYVSLPFTRGFSSTGGRNYLIIICSFNQSPSNHGTFFHFSTSLLSFVTSSEIIWPFLILPSTSPTSPPPLPVRLPLRLQVTGFTCFGDLQGSKMSMFNTNLSFKTNFFVLSPSLPSFWMAPGSLGRSKLIWSHRGIHTLGHINISGFWGDYSHTILTTVSPIDLLLSYHSYTQRNAV